MSRIDVVCDRSTLRKLNNRPVSIRIRPGVRYGEAVEAFMAEEQLFGYTPIQLTRDDADNFYRSSYGYMEPVYDGMLGSKPCDVKYQPLCFEVFPAQTVRGKLGRLKYEPPVLIHTRPYRVRTSAEQFRLLQRKRGCYMIFRLLPWSEQPAGGRVKMFNVYVVDAVSDDE